MREYFPSEQPIPLEDVVGATRLLEERRPWTFEDLMRTRRALEAVTEKTDLVVLCLPAGTREEREAGTICCEVVITTDADLLRAEWDWWADEVERELGIR